MKKKKLLKIINNEKDLDNFLSTTNEEDFLLGIKQSIESKNITALKKFIEHINIYRSHKTKNSIFNQALDYSIFQNHYDSIYYLFQNKNFNINEEFVINSIKHSIFPVSNNSLAVILNNTKFKKEHFITLVSLYLFNTEFIHKENISNCLNEIYSHYPFSSKEVYNFLFLNNSFHLLQFQKNSGFEEYSFFDFISSFDKDNYIIKKLPEYKKYIDNSQLFHYIDYLNKIKIQENFNKF